MNQNQEQKPEAELPPLKIGTLEERLRASAKVPLDSALRALAKQAGHPTHPNPIHQSLAYSESMRKRSKGD